jgi:hypothetical protein
MRKSTKSRVDIEKPNPPSPKEMKKHLSHINDCFPVFYYKALKEGYNENDYAPYVQVLLKSYLESDKILITQEQILKAKENINEIQRTQTS